MDNSVNASDVSLDTTVTPANQPSAAVVPAAETSTSASTAASGIPAISVGCSGEYFLLFSAALN